MPRLPWDSPLTAAAIALTCFLVVWAAISLSGAAPSRTETLAVAGFGAIGGVIGWWWVLFKGRRGDTGG
ncbi:hypothetical protein [Phycisphaera mikurensis]|uniref:DUF2530 domain-containing protein n=1 Tax=Phycisphaera mikurensis (strain NBRC 102666 / KCTC 22515 / FYK2301M01) TaxID=1142394 RepID=I0IBJ9_PHYMF|nr:hypothetical protein [Phycisphaera mikurensis]MBB6442833.1 heme A synthase [Phycisphaera mikurensis]BAM02637.1 hypothetical protein PSMK_04780 [Phycisphaera mikurensis NBRC 102666]